MNNKENISKSQQEVWIWKEKAAESIAHLPVGERVKFIMNRVKKTAAQIEGKRQKSVGHQASKAPSVQLT